MTQKGYDEGDGEWIEGFEETLGLVVQFEHVVDGGVVVGGDDSILEGGYLDDGIEACKVVKDG